MNIDCSRHDGSLCIECCKWMTFIIKKSEELEKQLEFYIERGCKIQHIKESDSIAITIPSVCPHLTVMGCRIYSTRPESCRNYDCRQDPFLKDGKYFLNAIVN